VPFQSSVDLARQRIEEEVSHETALLAKGTAGDAARAIVGN